MHLATDIAALEKGLRCVLEYTKNFKLTLIPFKGQVELLHLHDSIEQV